MATDQPNPTLPPRVLRASAWPNRLTLLQPDRAPWGTQLLPEGVNEMALQRG
jgi:hypothetical protein